MKQNCWSIKDQFPIQVYVRKSWTGNYVIDVPPMSMEYETFLKLDNWRGDTGVAISSYDYDNGEASYTAKDLVQVYDWAKEHEGKLVIKEVGA